MHFQFHELLQVIEAWHSGAHEIVGDTLLYPLTEQLLLGAVKIIGYITERWDRRSCYSTLDNLGSVPSFFEPVSSIDTVTNPPRMSLRLFAWVVSGLTARQALQTSTEKSSYVQGDFLCFHK